MDLCDDLSFSQLWNRLKCVAPYSAVFWSFYHDNQQLGWGTNFQELIFSPVDKQEHMSLDTLYKNSFRAPARKAAERSV